MEQVFNHLHTTKKMKTKLLFMGMLLVFGIGQAQYTTIPDANFEQALFDQGIDTVNGDHRVLTSAISGVTSLDVSYKGISSLAGIQGFASLQVLRCKSNQLTSLDLSANSALTSLDCSSNQLTSLNVSANTALTSLQCFSNSLSSLNISANTALTSLSCDGNSLSSLNVSANTALTSLSCGSNSLSSLNVSANTALTYLSCDSNSLSSLDVSANTALTELYCHNNSLTSLNVSANTALTTLICAANSLSSLNVSANTALTVLSCGSNSLSSLNVSASVGLTTLYCQSNSLSSLNVSTNTALTGLLCDDNSLSSLNISASTALTYLDCGNNSLSSLNVSANTALTSLRCAGNQLSSLNVSTNTALTFLYCPNNSLSSLDVRANTALTELHCYNNATLSCITVSDPYAAADNNLWSKDATASYATYCDLPQYTAIPDANFEQALFNQGIDTVNGDHRVLTSAISGVTSLNVSGKSISSLEGIEDFTSLQVLNCYNNLLSSLDVSANMALTTLICRRNSLSSLNVSANTALTYLDCENNSLSSLNVSANTALTELHCSNNSISSLNVSANASLTFLYCIGNSLSSLNVSANTALIQLGCGANSLSSLNVSANTALMYLDCGSNLLTSLNVSTNTALTYLDCTNNLLTSLNLSGLTELRNLYCDDNLLTSLNASGPAFLNFFTCTNNPNLSCITVRDPADAAAPNNFWTKDATASYSTNCGAAATTVSINSAFCGTTLTNIYNTIYCSNVVGATKYRFQATSPSNVAATYESTVNSFNFTQLGAGVAYNTTYGVKAAAYVNGNWTSYGSSCSIKTPVAPATTQINASQCGSTLTSMYTALYCTSVFGAQGYRFEVSAGGVSQNVDSNTNGLQLGTLSGIAFGTTYSIRVAVKNNNTYGQFGSACSITTPALPNTTKVNPTTCGATLSRKWNVIYCGIVTGATAYRFEWKNGGTTLTYTTSTNGMQIGNYTGWDLNTTYAVRVAIQYGGTWQAYGDACNITTPSSFARNQSEDAMALTVKAVPNPFETEYVLMAQGGNQMPVMVSVYDMLGKQVEQFSVEAHELENRSLGTNYSSGIYNVMISQGDDQQVVRIIKK
ncbi:MAG: hypothetical protein CFE24_01250 [Flavobacterium sp. BFFFF2]|nr:MAG: hypothetical protein CFE24_01250 [Flavobacterium sp. BFFFF2]